MNAAFRLVATLLKIALYTLGLICLLLGYTCAVCVTALDALGQPAKKPQSRPRGGRG